MIAALQITDLEFTSPSGPYRISISVGPAQLSTVSADPPIGTALARTVAGLVPPRSGTIGVGERDVTGEPPARRQIGYVPAGGALLPHLTIQQNVEYGLRRRELVRDVARDRVAAVIDRLELGSTRQMSPHHLSPAQQLRVALARAAASSPEVLVIDLPAEAGDAETLRELIRRVTPPASPGIAVLVCGPPSGGGYRPVRL